MRRAATYALVVIVGFAAYVVGGGLIIGLVHLVTN